MSLIIFLLGLSLTEATVPVLKFNPIYGANNNPNFTLPLNRNMKLTSSFSICMRFKFNILSSQCIFEAQDSIRLYFYEYRLKGGGNLFFANFTFFFVNDLNLQRAFNWQNVCITFDNTKAQVMLYLNTELKLNISGESTPVQVGGNIWLGNCLNLPFNGEMTDFNAWSRALSTSEILSFGSNCGMNITDEPDLFNWKNLNAVAHQSTIPVINSSNSACSQKAEEKTFLYISDFEIGIEDAFDLCDSLGGEVPLPKNEAEFNAIYHPREKLRAPSICKVEFWAPIFRLKNSSIWTSKNGSTDIYYNWDFQEPDDNDENNCTIMNHDLKLQNEACYWEFCFPCIFKRLVQFQLWGMCVVDSHRFDRDYIMESDTLGDDVIELQGISGKTKLVYKKQEYRWIVVSQHINSINSILAFYNGTKKFPVGNLDWYFVGICTDNPNRTYSLPLKLSKCGVDEFSCDSGNCINLSDRCNMVADCRDGSDERECNMIEIDEKLYRKLDPPIGTDQKTSISIDLTLRSAGPFDEINLSFKASFRLKLIWSDHRLTFFNLKDDNNNIASKDQLWIPALVFSSSEEYYGIRNDEMSSLWIQKKGLSTMTPKSKINNEEQYSGAENPLVFTRFYDLTFKCQYAHQNYPFDYQFCTIEIKAPYDLRKLLQLKVGVFKNSLTTNRTAQFEIIDVHTIIVGNNKFDCIIILRRMYLYQMTNTYLPTLTLLIISEVTLFFDEKNLQVAMGLSLTIMLVMYTIYQGVSQTLPRTADMKFIDWWLLFCVIVPFLAFMTEIMWEHNRIRKQSRVTKEPRKCWQEQIVVTAADVPIYAPFQRLIQMLFIVLTLAFIAGYAVIAVSYYYNNNIDLTNFDGFE